MVVMVIRVVVVVVVVAHDLVPESTWSASDLTPSLASSSSINLPRRGLVFVLDLVSALALSVAFWANGRGPTRHFY